MVAENNKIVDDGIKYRFGSQDGEQHDIRIDKNKIKNINYIQGAIVINCDEARTFIITYESEEEFAF